MAGEIDNLINEPSEVEKRIKDLSGKVKLTAEERDEKDRLLKESEAKGAEATIERDFYKGFSASTAKYPAATEFQDEILSKVKSGYSVEDATLSVLNSKGKLMPEAPAERVATSGGSAPITLQGNGTKSQFEMTQVERRAALIEAEQKGDISVQ